MKKKMWRGKPKPFKPLVFLDEGYLYASALPSGSVLDRSGSLQPRRQMVVTQTVIKSNSGKRMRFFSLLRWEDTGEPVKKAPKKFLPVQALRRQAGK